MRWAWAKDAAETYSTVLFALDMFVLQEFVIMLELKDCAYMIGDIVP